MWFVYKFIMILLLLTNVYNGLTNPNFQYEGHVHIKCCRGGKKNNHPMLTNRPCPSFSHLRGLARVHGWTSELSCVWSGFIGFGLGSYL